MHAILIFGFAFLALAIWDLMYDDGLPGTVGHKVWPLQWNMQLGLVGKFEHDGWILADDKEISPDAFAHHDEEVIL